MYNSYPYTCGDSITRTTYSGASDAASAFFTGFTLTMFIIFLAVYVLTVIGLWKVFKKAGKPGWHAIIPFLNLYDMFEIGGQKGVYIFMMFIPFVGPAIYGVYSFLANYNIVRAFNQSKGFLVGLTILPFIFTMILGFSSEMQYDRKRLVDDDIAKK